MKSANQRTGKRRNPVEKSHHFGIGNSQPVCWTCVKPYLWIILFCRCSFPQSEHWLYALCSFFFSLFFLSPVWFRSFGIRLAYYTWSRASERARARTPHLSAFAQNSEKKQRKKCIHISLINFCINKIESICVWFFFSISHQKNE